MLTYLKIALTRARSLRAADSESVSRRSPSAITHTRKVTRMSKIALTTRKPLVRALGLGGRVKREMAQPLYVLNGKVVAHMKRKLREVTVLDATTVSVDLTTPALAELPAQFGRLQVAEAVASLGGKPFTLTAAKAAPAKQPKAAKSGKPAKAGKPAAAGPDLRAVIAAIMGSDASDADKNSAIAALLA